MFENGYVCVLVPLSESTKWIQECRTETKVVLSGTDRISSPVLVPVDVRSSHAKVLMSVVQENFYICVLPTVAYR